MFHRDLYVQRRAALAARVGSGSILLLGNDDSPMNYPDNVYPFRQDSSFLYFFGLDRPGLAAIVEDGRATIFGDEATLDDVVWTGALPSIADQAARAGVETVLPRAELRAALARRASVHYLPPYRAENARRVAEWLGRPLDAVRAGASETLIRAVIDQRAKKSAEEVAEIETALGTTRDMHLAVMRATRSGGHERTLVAEAVAVAARAQALLAYPVILSVDGQILHNHGHANPLAAGRLVLGDFGAESPRHYASDVTRTIPVARAMDGRQRAVYEIVLAAQLSCIAKLAPGVAYKEVHLHAAREMTLGLKDLGLMKGDPDAAVAAGAHALFFPHGLGHMLGLDVHDMEDLGEDRVGYDATVARSTEFGLRSLRLARALEPGFVLTVEPGIYFIPELIDRWRAEKRGADFIAYDRLDAYRDFGGIRIEDDCLVTETGARVLGPAIPKTPAELDAIRG